MQINNILPSNASPILNISEHAENTYGIYSILVGHIKIQIDEKNVTLVLCIYININGILKKVMFAQNRVVCDPHYTQACVRE